MGKSKIENFQPSQIALSEWGKALSHPARIAILEFLLASKSCVCGDIVDALPLSQSTVSQHLKALKDIGIIKGSVSGPNICYCIDSEKWNQMQIALGQFIALDPQLEKINTCC